MLVKDRFNDKFEIHQDHVCENAVYLFTHGQCHALACILARQLDCKTRILQFPAVNHVVVELGNGLWGDVTGVLDEEQLQEEYGYWEFVDDDEYPLPLEKVSVAMSAEDMIYYVRKTGYSKPNFDAANHVADAVIKMWQEDERYSL